LLLASASTSHISSSLIREAVVAQVALDTLCPPAVAAAIRSHH